MKNPIRALLVLVLLATAFVTRAAETTSVMPGRRVFVTAHSFHIFVAARLAPLAKAAGIEGHQLVGAQMIGGSKVIQHWDLPDEKNHAKAALREGKVDVLTMSPHVYLPDDGIDNFVALGLEHNPKIRFLVQHSWTPWDGWLPGEQVANNEERDGRSLEIVRAANLRFRELVEKQVRALNQKHGREVVNIVPVGDAVLRLRELIAAGKAPGLSKQSDLFGDQIGHGKAPVLALATYCNFACIYRRSPVGLKDADPELDKLSPELKPLLQRLAWEVVSSYPLSGVTAAPFPGKKSDWNGFDRYDFQLDGKEVLVVAPKQAASGKPWVWHGEFFGHKPAPDIALLGRGFHVVYMSVPNLLGSPDAVAQWNKFYAELTGKFGFASKAALVGLSRGGLYCYNWAAANPDKVACIYGDAPVCDFKSWPGGKGKGKGSKGDWDLTMKVYHFANETEALAYTKNPVDNLAPLAKAKVPLLHVYGDADDVVPWDENTGVIAERYRRLGGSITLIAKPGVGHHPHGLDDSTPIVEFIAKHAAK